MRPARLSDAASLAPRLRHWDRIECRLGGHSPIMALALPWIEGDGWNTTALIRDDGEVVGMGGVRPLGDGSGSIWYLGADLKPHERTPFLRLSAPWVEHVSAPYRIVGNVVPAAHSDSIRWLRILAFDFYLETMHPLGVRILHFRRVTGSEERRRLP